MELGQWLIRSVCRKLVGMDQRRIYSRAPITEAIIDLRIAARPEIDLEVLRRLSDETQDRFPRIDPIYEATGKMQVRPGVSASASAHQNQTGGSGQFQLMPEMFASAN